MKNKLLLLCLSIFILSGCDDTKSVQWYKDNPNQMKERYLECRSSGSDSDDCRNVRQAHFSWKQANAPVPNLNWEQLNKKDPK